MSKHLTAETARGLAEELRAGVEAIRQAELRQAQREYDEWMDWALSLVVASDDE